MQQVHCNKLHGVTTQKTVNFGVCSSLALNEISLSWRHIPFRSAVSYAIRLLLTAGITSCHVSFQEKRRWARNEGPGRSKGLPSRACRTPTSADSRSVTKGNPYRLQLCPTHIRNGPLAAGEPLGLRGKPSRNVLTCSVGWRFPGFTRSSFR
jgi:hypothetical protein